MKTKKMIERGKETIENKKGRKRDLFTDLTFFNQRPPVELLH